MNRYVEYWKQGWPMRLLFGAAGAVLGYAYYAVIGCDGGCPITGNPWSSTAYGVLIGLLAYPGPIRRARTAPETTTEKGQERS